MAQPAAVSSQDAGTPADLEVTLEARKRFDEMCTNILNGLPKPANIEEQWIDIPLSDGWSSKTLVIRPTLPKPDYLDSPRVTTTRTALKRPMILYFFGGGFKAGSPLQIQLPARKFAEQFNATVLCPNYRLAPEHVWPQAMKDALEITQIVSRDQALHYGADLTHGFIIGGVSAGACASGVVAGLTTHDPKTYPLRYPLTGVFLSVPGFFQAETVPEEFKAEWTSRKDNEFAESFNTATMQELFDNFKVTDYASPWFSAHNLFYGKNKSENLSRHPPTYLAANQLDPLRDDALIYQKILAAAGIPTKHHLFPLDGHNAFSTMSPIMVGKSTNPTMEEGTTEGMKWLVDQVDLGSEQESMP